MCSDGEGKNEKCLPSGSSPPKEDLDWGVLRGHRVGGVDHYGERQCPEDKLQGHDGFAQDLALWAVSVPDITLFLV